MRPPSSLLPPVVSALLRRIHQQASSSALQFHSSWFSAEPTLKANTTAALFSDSPAAQIASFERAGYALIKRSEFQSLADIAQLETDILALLEEKQRTGFYYLMLRWFNLSGQYSVRSPDKRYSIPLPASSAVMRVLSAAIVSSRPLLSSQLGKNAPLVDLSSIISLPGSSRQRTHSDVPQSPRHRIISVFMALSSVTLKSGPTCLFAGSHTASFHRRHVGGAGDAMHRASFYSSSEEEGGEEEGQQGDAGDKEEKKRALEWSQRETAQQKLDIDVATAAAPVAALLEAGDILIYDSALFHYGGANVSLLPRALLMFSFQEGTSWGSYEEVTGFTYNCDASVKGVYSLNVL